MKTYLTTLHFDDYRPDDPSELVLRRKGSRQSGAGWNNIEMVQEHVSSLLQKAIGVMDYHDQLIITIEVREQEENEA